MIFFMMIFYMMIFYMIFFCKYNNFRKKSMIFGSNFVFWMFFRTFA